MSICLCSLVLNEIEWLEKLWLQHKDWPGMKAWVFVEGADRMYAEANPDMVSPEGLSVDGTTEFLTELSLHNPKVVYIQYGKSRCIDNGQGKCEMRQKYLDVCRGIRPDYLLFVDGDELYTKKDQPRIEEWMRWADEQGYNAYCFRYRHLWRPPCIAHLPVTTYEAIEGFWRIPHCHGWKWYEDLKYDNNHMTPKSSQHPVCMTRLDKVIGRPECVHTAFASNLKGREAKHNYYAARGEATDRRRRWYVESRAAFSTWQLGEPLPRGAVVIPYKGAIPEVLRETP